MRRSKKAMVRAGLAVLLSSSMTMNALASTVTTTGTVDVETTAGKNESVEVTISIATSSNADGGYSVTTTTEDNGVKTQNGSLVDYSGDSKMDTTENGVTTGTENTKYEVTNGDYHAEGGSETSIDTNGDFMGEDGLEIDVPLKEGGKNKAEGSKEGTVKSEYGEDTTKEDGSYNYTTETVVGQGSVTVETTDISTSEKVDPEKTDLDYVHSEVTPDGNNGLMKDEASAAPETYQPDTNSPSEGDKKYEFVFVGTGNTSQFQPAIVYENPLTEEELLDLPNTLGSNPYITPGLMNYFDTDRKPATYVDANGKTQYKTKDGYVVDENGEPILKKELKVVGPDGETYYLHRIDLLGDGHYVEGWYQDGEWLVDLNNVAVKTEDGTYELPIAVKNEDGTYTFGTQNVTTGKNNYKDRYGYYLVNKDGEIILGNRINGNTYASSYGNETYNQYAAVYSTIQQFVLVDTKTGEKITTYCADNATRTQDAYGYFIENLEDADYYDEEQAKQIRSIALNGYWGTKDDPNTEEIEFGSLEAMKEMMRNAKDKDGNRIFTDAEIENSMNDGVALSATQMAIWSCSNKMDGIKYINGHFIADGSTSVAFDKMVPTSEEDEVKLMFKLYEYLKNLDPTPTEKTTAETIIKEDFLSNMSLTVIEKADNHENNQDDDDENDAYVTNLTFALVVQPSTENGDDLVVKVLAADGVTVLASARIAGELQEGENYLTPDAKGNYTFENITVIEGKQHFNIKMEGIQHLKEGVYLYTSEVRTNEEGRDVSSQTMVGIAEGNRGVNVSMNITFDVNVEDEIVATEHVWRKEWVDRDDDNGGNGNNENTTIIEDPETPLSPTPLVMFEEEEVPLSDVAVLGAFEIEDDMIPLAVLPATGDNSLFLMFMSLLSGLSLAGASLVDKMKKRKR